MDHDIADGSDGYTIDRARFLNRFLRPLRDGDLGVNATAEKGGYDNEKDAYFFQHVKNLSLCDAKGMHLGSGCNEIFRPRFLHMARKNPMTGF
jgi:hypothetical protein